MAQIIVCESQMNFGPFDEEDIIQIEKIIKEKEKKWIGVKVAEFVLKLNGNILIIEAKTSAPHPGNKENFYSFIDEIEEKLSNTLLLTIAHQIRRHTLVPYFQFSIDSYSFIMVVVIKNHRIEWLEPIKSALEQRLRRYLKTIGGTNKVLILNEALAQKKGLIQNL